MWGNSPVVSPAPGSELPEVEDFPSFPRSRVGTNPWTLPRPIRHAALSPALRDLAAMPGRSRAWPAPTGLLDPRVRGEDGMGNPAEPSEIPSFRIVPTLPRGNAARGAPASGSPRCGPVHVGWKTAKRFPP